MKIASAGIASLAVALAMPADAQLLAHKDLSLATALTIATTAADTCKGQGYRVSVSVVGRAGEPLVQLRGDDASPHTMDFSRRKAFTARTFRVASGEIANRFKRCACVPRLGTRAPDWAAWRPLRQWSGGAPWCSGPVPHAATPRTPASAT